VFSAAPAVACRGEGDRVNRWSPYFLSILRIIAAFVYGVHGTQKYRSPHNGCNALIVKG